MKASNAKDYLPLVQALAEGKTIEYRDSDDEWIDCESPTFNQHSSRYRIKPELSQESLKMANYLEEMAKSIREMKIQPHDITNTAIASGCGTYREVIFIYTEKA